MPSEIAPIGSLTKPPGAMIFSPDTPSFVTATAFSKSVSKLNPTEYITAKAINVAPERRRNAFIICTQVVASMPPNAT